jgi:cyclopropane-fatty-acyl-phospholipid synthase
MSYQNNSSSTASELYQKESSSLETMPSQSAESARTESFTPYHEIEALARQGIDLLGEAFMDGRWSTPHLDETMATLFSTPVVPGTELPLKQKLARHARLLRYLAVARLSNLQAGSRSLHVAHRHYDLGNDLFEAMLDRSMTYTSGVWRGAKNLEEAQRAKLELLCQKLELKPGMTVLDIGCGWGNFAEYAAREYGVVVTGVTISREQAGYARTRCADLPVTILEKDYKKLSPSTTGTFDRVVSIEMIEAVGRKNLGTFFSIVHRSLKPDGIFALQAISAETVTRYSSARLNEFLLWILRYIFPNGYLPTLPELVTPARSLFVLENLDNLGNSYEKTLLAWEKNIGEKWPELSNRYDDRFQKMWRFYLLTCAALFRIRMTNVYQIVYRKSTLEG